MKLFSSWTGGDFLLFYTGLLACAGLAARWIPARLRPAGRRSTLDDPESIALLAGGRARCADSLLAELHVRGVLGPGETGKLAVAAHAVAASPAEQALMVGDPQISRASALKRLAVHGDRVTARLWRAGLLLRPEQHGRLRWLSIMPFAALFLLGLYRQRAGSVLGEPTGLLVGLLVVTLVLAVLRFVSIDPRTAAGLALVEDLRARNTRLARAPRAEEVALAVALFGTGVLVGTPWEPVHALRQRDTSGDSGGGDSGSDGGSGDGGGGGGGGGGGCGGCGG